MALTSVNGGQQTGIFHVFSKNTMPFFIDVEKKLPGVDPNRARVNYLSRSLSRRWECEKDSQRARRERERESEREPTRERQRQRERPLDRETENERQRDRDGGA